MYYRSGTDGHCALFTHQVAANILHERTSWPPPWKRGIKLKIQLRQSICILR